jgi:hypothetical protein
MISFMIICNRGNIRLREKSLFRPEGEIFSEDPSHSLDNRIVWNVATQCLN